MTQPRFADFRSDTVTLPSAGMQEAMQQVLQRGALGDDVFGDDPTVHQLQDFAAAQLGFAAALFAPSGTMTNLMALMSHCQRGDEALVGQQWHTYKWEGGGMAVLGSIQPQPLPQQPDGSIALHDLAAAIKPDDPHFAKTRLIVMENTTGGKVLPPSYLQQVQHLAHSRGLASHIDGARLMNAAVAGVDHGSMPDPADVFAHARAICQGYDSLSLCLSKGLGAPIGSLLLGSTEFIQRAKRVRKMLGGGMRQAGVIAAAGHYALQHQVSRLWLDHQRTAQIASVLTDTSAALPSTDFAIDSCATNMLFLALSPAFAKIYLASLAEHRVQVTHSKVLRPSATALATNGVATISVATNAAAPNPIAPAAPMQEKILIRLVTHLDIDHSAVEMLYAAHTCAVRAFLRSL
jgi:threonine aldolase